MLQRTLREYNRAKTQGDDDGEAARRLAREIEQLTRLADSGGDPATSVEWTRRADEWSAASDIQKDNMLLDIGKGLGLIVAPPFLGAGGVLYGAGLFVKASGNLLTGGYIERRTRDRLNHLGI
ncbi:hypothetical protein DFH08DRAFT_966083 [Mycena albidolilacea]|uniref:Uncharacterized protein n=1 Tax=Mycena albidolilacea TaxID=1033008 RepID=A0AAD6ZPZ1_9AGAR|nr:hypothetical protein DFH08DRAFT_966083 [Mycena albidolilacea]